jgi:hypothetical protein
MYASADGLERVRLFEVALNRHGRGLRLRMELPRFPDRPPRRWGREANAVQVTVEFWFVEELRVEGWSDDPAGVLSLTREGGRLRLAFDAPDVRITARCVFARIDRFMAYTDEPAEAEG